VARPGDQLEYRIEVSQHGNCSLQELDVVDYLPQESEWMAAIPDPLKTPDAPGDTESEAPMPVAQLRWRMSSLPEGQRLEFRVVIRVPERKPGWIRNTVCVSGVGMPRKCDVIETFVRRD
jgi:hypothetical protein